jgi:type II secretory pathway component PulF
MFRKAAISQSLRTLGTMINAGVSVLEGVAITRDVVGNRLFKNMFRHVYGRLQRGDQLSDALLDAPYLPRPIWQMLNAGERTGHLGPAMERVADLCESDLRHAIRTMTQFIEPTMIVVMGVIVGGIALGMLLPIFQISRVMTH